MPLKEGYVKRGPNYYRKLQSGKLKLTKKANATTASKSKSAAPKRVRRVRKDGLKKAKVGWFGARNMTVLGQLPKTYRGKAISGLPKSRRALRADLSRKSKKRSANLSKGDAFVVVKVAKNGRRKVVGYL